MLDGQYPKLCFTDTAWIESVIDVDKPIVVFTHDRPSNVALNVLSSSDNVLAVFKGHDHEGTYDEYNGLLIYGMKGSVMMDDPEDRTANAFYDVEVGLIRNGTSKKGYVNIKGYVRGDDLYYISNKEF